MSATYQVLARKWRPQQFDEVVGQEHVTRTLKNAISADRIAHAYLLVGPRGTGKTTTARIFAKALNCEQGPTPTPCDQCAACREIMEGRAMDVIEIDAASNTGVDHVRELRENARYSPVRGPYKIYVIDEVHMLSSGAFNALLKTLEEPPAHVKFVLATTDPQKVPATIHSRCQRFDLRRIATPVITEAMGRIAKAEGIDIDDDALLAIARGAEGGMRDAQSAMDQLISFIGTTIREADVLSVFGLVSREAMEELAGAVLSGDMSRIIERVSELDAAGKDMQRLVIELLEHFRNVLLCMYAPESGAGLDITEAQWGALKAQATQSHPGRVLQIVQILTDTEGRLRYALSRRTLVETALIRAARAATVASIDELLKEINALKTQLGASASTASPPHPEAVPEPKPKKKRRDPDVAPTAPPSPEIARDEPGEEPEASEEPVVSTEPDPAAERAPEAVSEPLPAVQLEGDHQRLFAHWHDLIEQAGHAAPLLRNYLLDAKPVQVTSSEIVIGFDPEFASGVDNVNIPRNRTVLQRVFGRFLGRDVGVTFRTAQPGDALPTDVQLPEGHSRDREKAVGIPEEAMTVEQRWIQEPVVRQTLEAFNGEIIDIRE